MQALCMLECSFCSAAASNQSAKQEAGGCIDRQYADISCNCNAKLELPSLGPNATTVHAVLCRALHDRLEVFASANLLQLWHAAVHVVNHWPHNLFKTSRFCCCTRSPYKPVNLVLDLTDLHAAYGHRCFDGDIWPASCHGMKVWLARYQYCT